MVRNTGGKKTKSFASKDFKQSNTKLREAIEQGEYYAIVTKMNGNGFYAFCLDGVSRLCMIRGKFKGRGKSSNLIGNGSWVLVGTRSWESTDKKTQVCDLVEVYSQLERDRLKTIMREEDVELLMRNDVTNVMTENNPSNIAFMSQKQLDYIETMERALISKSKEVVTFNTAESGQDDQYIDVSDI